mmetsp:Transcript_55789/g.130535  ORF Transcript_55789/g.130535 Transcript_55789/m.130535 type:complete len:294 (+) Transcript_55789:67-948(+)
MSQGGSALLRLVAIALAIHVGCRSVNFLSMGMTQHTERSVPAAAHAEMPVTRSAEPVAPVRALRTANSGSHFAKGFSRETLLPSLLLSARVMVSIGGAVARRAKAPVSDFQAPSGARNFQEMALGFTTDIAKNNLGESFYRPWVPYITTIFLFIFGCNWSGALIPWKLLEIPEGELAAPTNNINTTVALSLMTSVAYFGGGLAKKGLGYFARYVKPTVILLPINILEDFTKPLSLSFRLFGNVLADELTVAVLTFLVPFIIPLPIMALGLFAGSIQALIFSTLASAYIFEALE